MTDLLFHGGHPFVPAVEQLILEIHAANPTAWQEFAEAAEGWTRVQEDACGRVLGYLGRVLEDLGPMQGRGH